MKSLSYNTRVFLNYSLINIFLVAASFLCFLFNEKLIPASLFICSLTGAGCLALLIKSQNKITTENGKASFVPFLLLRYALMIIGIVASALMIKYTMDGEDNKYRYMYVILCALPYFTTSLTLLITKPEENK